MKVRFLLSLLGSVSLLPAAESPKAALAAALDALGRFVSAEVRRGKLPLGPREWGMFLGYVKARGP